MLDRFNDRLQTIINTLLGARGKGRHPLKSVLNGSWLGHPLHPAITDIAIGGILFAGVCDIAWLAFPVTGAWAPRAAEFTLILACWVWWDHSSRGGRTGVTPMGQSA